MKGRLGVKKLKEEKVETNTIFDFDSLQWNKVDA